MKNLIVLIYLISASIISWQSGSGNGQDQSLVESSEAGQLSAGTIMVNEEKTIAPYKQFFV